MAGLVRPGDAASRRRERHRAARGGGAGVVPALGLAVVAGWDAAALTFLARLLG
jgi:hypothetical protein